jgi:hypothetical protein
MSRQLVQQCAQPERHLLRVPESGVLVLSGLGPQPRGGSVDEFLVGTERGPAGALLVVGDGVPLGRRSGPLGGSRARPRYFR